MLFLRNCEILRRHRTFYSMLFLDDHRISRPVAAFCETCVEVKTTHEYNFVYKIHMPQELHNCCDCQELGELTGFSMVSLLLKSGLANERTFVRLSRRFCTLDHMVMYLCQASRQKSAKWICYTTE